MRIDAKLRSWARTIFRRRDAELQMDAELRSHIEMYAEHLVRSGMSRDEAVRHARLAFGGLESAKEACRDAVGISLLESLWQDLRFAFRLLPKNPGFTSLAVLTLALGIGANAAIFSVVNAVLLEPLAYKDPDRLVTILHYGTSPISPANYLDYRAQSRSYESLGAAEAWSPSLTGVDAAELLRGLRVTQSTLPLLGVQPLLGRLFAQGEDIAGNDQEVVLSYGLWQRRFAGDRSVIGKRVLLDGTSYSIVGVMPADFDFAPFWATHTELWVPLALPVRAQDRGGSSLRLFARLKHGVTLAHARAEMATITARLEKMYPGTNTDIVVLPLKEKVVGNIETPLLVLLGAVGFVLLIACANVGHMLLARAAARQKEIALRRALGARRSRVIRQVLTENLVLAAVGGALGLLIAFWGTHALVALSPADVPRVESIAIDGRVVIFLLVITVLTSVAFGLAPALRASDRNLTDALNEGGRGSSDGVRGNRLLNILVASEFALALTLLIAAGLMIRSFLALESVDPGFTPHGVLSMMVSVSGSHDVDAAPRAIVYRQMLERVRSLPGVESAAGINHLPLAGDLWDRTFIIEGRPTPAATDMPDAVYRVATPRYFQTMGIRLVQGRDISASDVAGAPPVVVINETMAHTYWPGQNPLGQRIAFTADKNRTWMTVVGVVKDPMLHDWAGTPTPELYLAAFQDRDFLSNASYITLVVRTSGDAGALTSSVEHAIWSLDSQLPISGVITLDEVIRQPTHSPVLKCCCWACLPASRWRWRPQEFMA